MTRCPFVDYIQQGNPKMNLAPQISATNISSSAIRRLSQFDPRRNLPTISSRKRGEANFVLAFQRDYMHNKHEDGVGGRYFALFSYGIADFVWLDFKGSLVLEDSHRERMSLTAFEMKIDNWKRALAQAYRYKYYSDRVIVVLPVRNFHRAESNLSLFSLLGVGLWSYDPKYRKINKRYTPPVTSAKNPTARLKAIDNILNQSKFC